MWKSANDADSHKLLGKHKTLSTLPTASAAIQLTNVQTENVKRTNDVLIKADIFTC